MGGGGGGAETKSDTERETERHKETDGRGKATIPIRFMCLMLQFSKSSAAFKPARPDYFRTASSFVRCSLVSQAILHTRLTLAVDGKTNRSIT